MCQIQGKASFDTIREKEILSDDEINSKIDGLVRKQLVNKDRKTLTEVGRDSLKIVLAGGVFDIIHPGHIYTLSAAKN